MAKPKFPWKRSSYNENVWYTESIDYPFTDSESILRIELMQNNGGSEWMISISGNHLFEPCNKVNDTMTIKVKAEDLLRQHCEAVLHRLNSED